MQANIEILHSSKVGTVFDFHCLSQPGSGPQREYSTSFSINFTRKGTFGYRAGAKTYEVDSGVVLLERPNCERVITHPSALSDECTVFELADSFTEDLQTNCGISESRSARRLFGNRGGASLLPATANLEFLHSSVLAAARTPGDSSILEVEVILIEILDEICKVGNKKSPGRRRRAVEKRIKERHIEAIERAKAYILANFQDEIALTDIARVAYVSVFHFSRLFKQFTARSPHQYLVDVRLKQAELLLRNTSHSVTQVCLNSGFNSFEHFITTFTRRNGCSPSQFRHRKSKAEKSNFH